MIPLGKPDITEEDIKVVTDILRSGRLAVGDTVKIFENEFAQFIGKRHAISVNSGTIALFLAIKLMGLKHVIIPAITCPDVLNAIMYGGARPIIVDVEERTHNINPDLITQNLLKKADGIVITNTYGHPAQIDEILELCSKYNLILIEDFAQSTGAWYKKKRCGSFGDVCITSFYAGKMMTTGHGGMILTDSDEIAQKARLARGDSPYEYEGSIIPLNLNITDFQAALGLNQMKKLDNLIQNRRSVARQYTDGLQDLKGITILDEQSEVVHCYYKYVVCIEELEKSMFIQEMNNRNIQVGTLYDPPLNRMRIVREQLEEEIILKIADTVAKRAVSLPMYPSITQDQIQKVITEIKSIISS